MWQHTPVSIRGWLLLASAGFGVVHLVGELFGAPLLPSAELLAWVSLLGYVAVAGRHASTRVRLALAGGLAILGVLAAVRLLSTVDSSSSAGFQFLSPDRAPRSNALELAGDAVWEATPWLAAYACLALAAIFLPKRRTRAGIAVAALGIGVAVTYVGLEVWSRDAGLAAAIAAAPPLLVAVLAFAVGGQVSRWLPTAGLALLALAALSLLDDVLDRVRVVSFDAFLQPGLRYGTQESVAVVLSAPASPGAAAWALAPAIQLAAAVAVTAGCLRRPANDAPEADQPREAP